MKPQKGLKSLVAKGPLRAFVRRFLLSTARALLRGVKDHACWQRQQQVPAAVLGHISGQVWSSCYVPEVGLLPGTQHCSLTSGHHLVLGAGRGSGTWRYKDEECHRKPRQAGEHGSCRGRGRYCRSPARTVQPLPPLPCLLSFSRELAVPSPLPSCSQILIPGES